MYDLSDALSVYSPNAEAKTAAVVGGMLAGADSIDDLDLLRHGGMGRLFAGVRAPSKLGKFLRSFTHGHCSSGGTRLNRWRCRGSCAVERRAADTPVSRRSLRTCPGD